MSRILLQARQTGRTTRMVDDAKRVAAEGAPVIILAHTSKYAQILRHQFLRGERSIKVVALEDLRLDAYRLDWRSGSIQIKGMQAALFADHTMIETEYAAMLEHLHRWDARRGEWGFKRLAEDLDPDWYTMFQRVEHAEAEARAAKDLVSVLALIKSDRTGPFPAEVQLAKQRELRAETVRGVVKAGDVLTHTGCMGCIFEHEFVGWSGNWIRGTPTRDTFRFEGKVGPRAAHYNQADDIAPDNVTHINRVPVEAVEFLATATPRKLQNS